MNPQKKRLRRIRKKPPSYTSVSAGSILGKPSLAASKSVIPNGTYYDATFNPRSPDGNRTAAEHESLHPTRMKLCAG